MSEQPLELNIDLDSITIAEIEEIEEAAGAPFDQVFQSDKPKGKMLRAMAYVIMRRDNPDLTWEEAGKVVIRLGGEEDDPSGEASA